MKLCLPLFMVLISFHPTFIQTMLYTQKSSKSKKITKTISLERKIGRLLEGCEASFLALEGNPIDNLENVRKIKYRFKQGYPKELNRRK